MFSPVVGQDVSAGEGVKIAVYPPKITAKYIDKYIGKRKALLIYVSWCPACRQLLPAMMKMEKLRPNSVIAVSVDANDAKFARYIENYKKVPFKVILNKGAEEGLQQTLSKYGVQEWKSYPTVILLDEKNKAVAQGNLSIEEIAQYVMTSPDVQMPQQQPAQK